MKRKVHESRYFCGNKISEYGLQCGYLDYRTLASAFDAVLVNDITKLFFADIYGEWNEAEQINGYIDNSEQIEALQEQIKALEEDKNAAEQIEALENQIRDLEYEQEEQQYIYQYYIISGYGAELLQDYTNDPVFYLPVLDCYVWGVTHFGTSWDYVLTDVRLELGE